jgi:hypothetical protein
MPIQYPTGLPLPKVTPFNYFDELNYQENDVSIGPPRRELFTENAPRIFSAQFIFSRTQLQLFNGWYYYELTKGVSEFEMNIRDDEGLQAHTCLISGIRKSQIGTIYQVSATLRAEPIAPDECVYDSLLVLYSNWCGNTVCGLLEGVDDVVNTQLPATWGNLKYGTDFS